MAQLSVGDLRKRCSLVLSTVVHDISLLARHGIVDCVESRRTWHGRDNRLKSISKLLVIEAIVGSDGRLVVLLLLAHSTVETHTLHLLLCRGKIKKLLL